MSWTVEGVLELLELPFNDLLYVAHAALPQQFDPNVVQFSTLLSLKPGVRS
jgi:biotin synthase